MEAGALQAPAGLGRISISGPLLRLRSDEQLVALFRAGNEDAFQVIFDRYRQRLFAYTRQMLAGSRQDAEDALQDVFIRAYGALRANDRPVSLRAWLYRVAHNRCIDQLRRPTPASADVFDVSRTPLRDPLEETQRREDLRRLVDDVRRLPEAQRSALLMREMDGLSYQELADALGVTVPAIKSLLVRARIGLVEAIEARDTACTEIRTDLLASYDRGVRTSGRARRHLRDCAGCRTYRTELRTVQRGLGALGPGHTPLSLLAKLFGIGGSAGGAAAGGSAVVAGGGAAVVGGGAATVTACKVAAIVCSAAFVTGAAQQVEQAVKRAVGPTPVVANATPAHSSATRTATSLTATRLARMPAPATAGAAAAYHPRAHRADAPSAAVAAAAVDNHPITPDNEVYATPEPFFPLVKAAPENVTGGARAPDEDPVAVAPEDPAPVLTGPTTRTPSAPPVGAGPGTGAPAASTPTSGSAPAAGTTSAAAPAAAPAAPAAPAETPTVAAGAPTP